MLTYEDLRAAGEDEKKRMDFLVTVVGEHKRSAAYKYAVSAQQYYDGENTTIAKYEKIIYDMLGKAHVDMWTANHKIASQIFSYVIDQETSYLLGNGIRFAKEGTKKALGLNFDESMTDALEFARVDGSAFVFWNLDHIDVFRFTEFAPIYGEETGLLMAGVRFWQIDTQKPQRFTLYEPDGYTQYIQRAGKGIEVYKPKEPYVISVVETQAEGEISAEGSNYATFPIVPLYANKAHKSALNGKRNTVDALDLASSSMVNNVDEGALIYWVLTGFGGMDDDDDQKFLDHLKATRVVHVNDDEEGSVEAHTVEAPFEGTKVTIDELRDRLHEDFQDFDAKALTSADMSATAIEAGYTRLDMKCDKIEREVTRCINGILALAGLDDKPSYTRNRILNRTEETQRIIMQATYLPDDYIMKALLTVNGDLDQYEEIAKQMDEDSASRMKELEDRLKEAEANPQENPENGQEGGDAA